MFILVCLQPCRRQMDSRLVVADFQALQVPLKWTKSTHLFSQYHKFQHRQVFRATNRVEIESLTTACEGRIGAPQGHGVGATSLVYGTATCPVHMQKHVHTGSGKKEYNFTKMRPWCSKLACCWPTNPLVSIGSMSSSFLSLKHMPHFNTQYEFLYSGFKNYYHSIVFMPWHNSGCESSLHKKACFPWW